MELPGKTILLVEDEDVIAAIEKKWLTDEGYNVIHVTSGTGAIDAVKEDPDSINLILMDIELGKGIDGTEAARQILENKDLSVLFISSHTDKSILEKAESIAAYGFITKSSEPAVLLSSVKMAIRLFEAKAALKESQCKYKMLFDNSMDAILLTSPDGKISAANAAACSLFGMTEDELIQRGRNGLVDINDPRVASAIEQRRKTGKFFGEISMLRKDGSKFPVEVSTAIFKGSGGKEMTCLIIRDISKRKEAAEKLIYSNNLLNYFITHARAAIAIFDKEMKYLYVSDQLIKDYRLKEKNIIGHNHYDIFPEIPERWKSVHRLALKGAVLSSPEDAFPREDGSVDWVRWDCRPWHEPDGTIGGIIINSEVITEKRKMLQDVQRSENKFRTLFENSPLAISIAFNGFLYTVNKAYSDMFGYGNPKEMTGMHITELVRPEKADSARREVEKWKLGQWPQTSLDIICVKKDGTKFPVRLETNIISIEEGDAAIGFLSDMTEIVNREEKIKASLKEKEVLLKEIHHRVKNNLQIISSLLSLQSDMVNAENFAEAFNDCRNRVKSMAIIHEKLYRSANVNSIDFRDYAEELITYISDTYSSETSEISVEYDCDQVYLDIDKAVSCALMLNEIISNAYKYAFSNTKKGILTFITKKEENNIVFKVKDNGPGFNLEEFDINTTETLGLVLVNSLVSQLDGSIEIKNNGGAEFTIKIPA